MSAPLPAAPAVETVLTRSATIVPPEAALLLARGHCSLTEAVRVIRCDTRYLVAMVYPSAGWPT